jgi:hypothetical protein
MRRVRGLVQTAIDGQKTICSSDGMLTAMKETAMKHLMQWSYAWPFLVAAFVGPGVSPVFAEGSQGMMERVEATAKEIGEKIESKTKAVVQKVEEKHVVDKVGEKLKKAANKTAEGFEKAGNKISEKLKD